MLVADMADGAGIGERTRSGPRSRPATRPSCCRRRKTGTLRSYGRPHPAIPDPAPRPLRIDRLRPGHIDATYGAIAERNTTIATLRTSPDPAKRDQVKNQPIVGPRTLHVIHATGPQRRDAPPPLHRHQPRPHGRTTHGAITQVHRLDRPTRQNLAYTGTTPSPVMIWSPKRTGRFLAQTHDTGDRLYALYHLITFTGLRRGEACGLHWEDLDLDAATLTIRWQLVQHGWALAIDTPPEPPAASPRCP